MVRRTSFANRFDMDKIMQIVWFRFTEYIVSSRSDFALYALFDIKPMKRFECTSNECLGVQVKALASVF